jgi:hypothetical protein
MLSMGPRSIMMSILVLMVSALAGSAVEGFVLPPPTSLFASSGLARRQDQSTELSFGLPSFQPKANDDEKKEAEDPKLEKSSIGLKGLVQLITAGAGAPFLGDFQASSPK